MKTIRTIIGLFISIVALNILCVIVGNAAGSTPPNWAIIPAAIALYYIFKSDIKKSINK